MKTIFISRARGIREQILRERTLARRDEARRSKFIVLGLILSRKNKGPAWTKRIVPWKRREGARKDGDKGEIYYYTGGRITGTMKKLGEEIRAVSEDGFVLTPRRIFLTFSLRLDIDFLGNFRMLIQLYLLKSSFVLMICCFVVYLKSGQVFLHYNKRFQVICLTFFSYFIYYRFCSHVETRSL